jgi:hypothetical protein
MILTADEFTDRLQRVTPGKSGWMDLCLHDDSWPSLSINEGADRRNITHREIVDQLGFVRLLRPILKPRSRPGGNS